MGEKVFLCQIFFLNFFLMGKKIISNGENFFPHDGFSKIFFFFQIFEKIKNSNGEIIFSL